MVYVLKSEWLVHCPIGISLSGFYNASALDCEEFMYCMLLNIGLHSLKSL